MVKRWSKDSNIVTLGTLGTNETPLAQKMHSVVFVIAATDVFTNNDPTQNTKVARLLQFLQVARAAGNELDKMLFFLYVDNRRTTLAVYCGYDYG